MIDRFPGHQGAVEQAALDYIFDGGWIGDPRQHDYFRDRFRHLSGIEQRVVITRCKLAVGRKILEAVRDR